MQYEEAIKIGSVCDGYIKCTYTRVWAPGIGTFSFQARNFKETGTIDESRDWTKHVGYSGAYDGEGPSDKHIIDSKIISITSEMPIVHSTGKILEQDKRYVSVKIDDIAREAFFFLTEKRWGKGKLTPEQQKFTELMQADGEFYVKKAVIDWIPTNIDNLVIEWKGKQVRLVDALEDAKKRYEQAKVLIGAASATAVM